MMRRVVRRFGNAFTAMPLVVKVALLWLIFIVAAAIYSRLDRLFGQALPLQDPFYQPFLFGEALPVEGPSSSHLLGTDVLSRDNLARLLHGGWVSLIVAGTVVILSLIHI